MLLLKNYKTVFMKVKLNHNQLATLAGLLQKIVGNDATPPDNLEARLLFCLLSQTYKQVRKKLIDKKPKYSIQMTEPEALAFWVFFSKGLFIIKSDDICETTYNFTIVNGITSAIHKQFSSN